MTPNHFKITENA